MKPAILILLLTLSTALAIRDPGAISLWGSYDDTGYYRSDPVLVVGGIYTFQNNGTELVSVVVMPGQNLAGIEPGWSVGFVAQGTWLLIFSPFERGQSVTGLKLTKVAQ